MRRAYLIPIMMFVTLILAGSAQAMPDIEGKTVEYSAKGVAMKGYLACDKNISGKKFTIAVAHKAEADKKSWGN